MSVCFKTKSSLQSDVCSAGEDELGQECPSFFTSSIKSVAQCEGFQGCDESTNCSDCLQQEGRCAWHDGSCLRRSIAPQLAISQPHKCPGAQDACAATTDCVVRVSVGVSIAIYSFSLTSIIRQH
jgi:hypothetical protein